MRLIDTRAARRGLASAAALLLCLGPMPAMVLAQEAAPAGGPATIAAAGEPVLLRENPGYDAVVLAPVGDGSTVEVAGGPLAAADGTTWLPVVSNGQHGYVPAGYVVTGSAPAPEPAPAPPVEAPAPPPAEAAPVAAPAPASATGSGTATITTDANLRSWPGADADILTVLPQNTPVTIDGPAENGYVPVSGNGGSGWVAAELLAGGAPASPNEPPPLVAQDPLAAPAPAAAANALPAPAAAPAPEAVPAPAPAPAPAPDPAPAPAAAPDRQSTGIVWPFSGGEWKVVQGYNNGTHTNRGGFAQYKYSLDWARSDGNTAGQAVYAPVSGTIKWTDRGSGGILIDAGNGYGVALFHITLDRSVARGGSVERGQRIGTISGPGGDGFMSMEHIEIAAWRLKQGGGHESVPFVGPNAIAGQEFPDNGGGNQHMGATISP